MKGTTRPDVERLPADLDRFLGDFFDRRDWQAEIKFDPAENRLFLDVRLETGRLSDDDRFLSLVEHFARAQRAVLRGAGGLSFRCRLFAADGADLTARLHQRGSAYLDDLERGSAMRRRIAWLGFRRRLVRTVAPLAALWAGAVALIAGVIGLPLEGALLLAAPAIGIDLEAALSPYPSEAIDLDKGDCAVFFTDGITELRDARGAFFEDVMPEVLAGLHDRPASDVLSRLLERAERFSAQPPADDIAIVCLRLTRRPDVKKRDSAADTAGKEYADDEGTRES